MISLAIVLILLFCSSLVCLFSCTPSSSGPRTPPSSSFHTGRRSPRFNRRIRNDEELDSAPFRALNKLIKGAKYAFADATLLRITNKELLQANVRRHHRANRSGAHYGGKARVLSLEDVQQRQQWAKDKQKMKDEKKNAAQLKRAEQDLIKTLREMC